MSMEVSTGRLSGKVAIITGGAGNIGRVITRRYLEEGATVFIADLFDEPLQAFRQELVEQDGFPSERVLTLQMDGSHIVRVRECIAEVIEKFGRIDILVNNAGSPGPRQRLADLPMSSDEVKPPDCETLHQAIGNLLGIIWHPIRAAAEYMAPGSSVINVSTIFSRTDYYGRMAYVVPKAAVNSLSRSLARELGERGIRVNTIYPGPIDSERIRNVFQSMDSLKGIPEGSTAQEFFDIMALSRPNEQGQLQRTFPKPLDIANTMVFLGSDESVGFAAHSFEVTNGMDVPAESSTVFVSRPGLRNVDASGKVVLVCAGDQVDDVITLTRTLRSRGAEVAITFRDRTAISQAEDLLREQRQQDPDFTPPMLTYLNPLETAEAKDALNRIQEATGAIHDAIILPAHGNLLAAAGETSVVDVKDDVVAQFLEGEIVGAIAMASHLQNLWQEHAKALPTGTRRVIFMSNADDGCGNLYNDMLRSAIEQLIRIWRHETKLDEATHGIRPVWANQIIRYVNNEPNCIDFACSWATKLINSDRSIDEINLYVPQDIAVATGTQRSSFGWAESLFGLHLGKVALITGGSAGIGGQLGRLLALSGASVMLAARGAGQLEQIRDSIQGELKEAGYINAEARVQIFPDCDVSNEESLKKLADHTLTTFGRVDFLINNAGVSGKEEMVIDMPLDGWRWTLNANLISNYSLIRKILPSMKARGSGYVLNVSSYFGGEKYVAIPYPNRSDYAVSKAGQRAMAETWARFLGPEVQINSLAPGPVDGDRLRGTGERPGLFKRRARLILENKRLNDVHAALIEAQRGMDWSVDTLLPPLLKNRVDNLREDTSLPGPLQRLLDTIWNKSDPESTSRTYLFNETITEKLVQRLVVGGYLSPDKQDSCKLAELPPEPFFTVAQIDRDARKVGDGIRGMLYLQRMPTEFDVAIATVHYLADRNVSGETFHPSGGLRFERTVTEGELFGKASPASIARLRGTTVYLLGEHLKQHLTMLIRTYLQECDVARVILLTETEEGAREYEATFQKEVSSGHLRTMATHGNLEQSLDRAYVEFGRPGPVVCTPFRPLPVRSLVGPTAEEWDNVLDEAEFADMVEQHITHHFRVARKISLVDGAQLVLVTPASSSRSTHEELAMANFIKTTLHAFTATLGVESERIVHNVVVNQVDLARRARNEAPRNAEEEAEELRRFVNAVLLTSSPQTDAKDSRYRSRIYRGNAITV